ncbi:MAG TPA: aromatic ring-opening dioxygenase LigA [Candidatus Limnocylindria bacterium]
MQRVDEVQALGWMVAGAGAVSCVAGVGAWLTIRSQLAAERIVVAGSAPWLAGCPVKGPLTALAQAEAIRRTTLNATGGRTYGQMESDDPNAEMAMNASLLRSSLFTSILAFGVAAAQVGLGAALTATGVAIGRAGRRLR